MDIPRVLEVLRPDDDWGSQAGTHNTYEELVAGWRGANPAPTLSAMQSAWAEIQAAAAVTPDAVRASQRGQAIERLKELAATDPASINVANVAQAQTAIRALAAACRDLAKISLDLYRLAARANVD